MSDAIAFLEQMVRCYTPSKSERSAAECAVARMKGLGFAQSFIDEAGNAVGITGAESGPTLLLLGHIDTVPGEIPIRHESREGRFVLYGRGTVDAKGPLCTFIEAIGRLPPKFPLRCVVVGAVEEEISTSKGARYIGENLSQPLAVIIGEPSGVDGITLGYRGRLVSQLSVKRDMAHWASGEQSAGDVLVQFVQKVQAAVEKRNAGRDRAFDQLSCTVQQLSSANDGLQESGAVELGFRLGVQDTPQAVEEILREARSFGDLQLSHSEIAARYSPRGRLPQAFRGAIRANGREPRHVVKTGTSDMNVLATVWNCEMVAYGPGDSSLDHTPHEHIALADYEQAIEILTGALTRFGAQIAEGRSKVISRVRLEQAQSIS